MIAWLRLPPADRPHFITLYYSEPDHSGHKFGPDTEQTAEAVHHVDALVGTLVADLKTVDLPVDVIVVSDHGMAQVQGDWITLDQYFADAGAFGCFTAGIPANPGADRVIPGMSLASGK